MLRISFRYDTAVHSRPALPTVAEVAERLRVSEKTVRRLIAAGLLPAVRLGGPRTAIRVAADELERWLYAEETEGDTA